MPIKIVGCPDKNFTPYVHRAAKYYANCLMTKKMQENTRIIIKFSNDLKDCGYAYVAGKNASGRPRKFLIDVHSGLGARVILETIAHEMVHVKQFAYGHTNETLSKWLNTRIDTDKIDYWFQPWEIEAHGLEIGLVTKFAIHEQLWTVFKDFRKPGTIKKSKINWKIPQTE
mgnify:CR=1 FL=1